MSITAPDDRITHYEPVVPTTSFAADFPVFDNDDIKVFVDGVERTDFAVSATYVKGISTDARVVFSAGITGKIDLVGARDPRRTSRFINGAPLQIWQQNLALDTVEAELQEAKRDILRSHRAPYGEEGGTFTANQIGAAQGHAEEAAASSETAVAAAGRAIEAAAKVQTASDFGATGDDETDDTDAIELWLNSGTHLTILTGQYRTGKITVPSTVKSIRALGEVIFKPLVGTFANLKFRNEWGLTIPYETGDSAWFLTTPETVEEGIVPDSLLYKALRPSSGAIPNLSPDDWEVVNFENYWTFDGGEDQSIFDLGWEVPAVQHPFVRSAAFNGNVGLRTYSLRFPEGGAIGLYGGNCKDVVHSAPRVGKFAWHGIHHEGSGQEYVILLAPQVHTEEVGIGTCINFFLGRHVMAKDAQVSGARTFGMSAFDVDHVTLDGQVWNTMHEAFNVIGARNFSITGQAEWDGDTSIDYGCSVDGTAGIACRNGFVNVRVKQSFKTGIILTGDVLDTVVIPRVQDCNLSGDNDEGGVVLSGSNCQRNVVLPGFVYDSTGGTLHKYGIAELNLGNGEPSNNALYVGEINGFAIGAVRRAGPTTKIIGGTSISQSAAVSPTSGAYGSATATLQWSFDRELVVVDNLLVSIPAVGTGAGPIVVALPVSCNPQSGVLHGYDDATGKAVTGSVGTNVVRIRYADGTTGFVNGTSINLSGRYKPTA